MRCLRFSSVALFCYLGLTALLAGCSGASSQTVTQRPHVTPTPTLDAESQAYVTLLRTYYTPLVAADPAEKLCYMQVETTRKLSDMLACRSTLSAMLTAAQSLRAQLATAVPPARWQSQHTALQQAVQGLIGLQKDQLAAIDAQDVTRFLSYDQQDAFHAFCPIVTQLNAGPPLLSPAFSPVEPLFCE